MLPRPAHDLRKASLGAVGPPSFKRPPWHLRCAVRPSASPAELPVGTAPGRSFTHHVQRTVCQIQRHRFHVDSCVRSAITSQHTSARPSSSLVPIAIVLSVAVGASEQDRIFPFTGEVRLSQAMPRRLSKVSSGLRFTSPRLPPNRASTCRTEKFTEFTSLVVSSRLPASCVCVSSRRPSLSVSCFPQQLPSSRVASGICTDFRKQGQRVLRLRGPEAAARAFAHSAHLSPQCFSTEPTFACENHRSVLHCMRQQKHDKASF